MRLDRVLTGLFIALLGCGDDPEEQGLRPGKWDASPSTIVGNTCTGLGEPRSIDFTLAAPDDDNFTITNSRITTECTHGDVLLSCAEVAGDPRTSEGFDATLTDYYSITGEIVSATEVFLTETKRTECAGAACNAYIELFHYPPLPCTSVQTYTARTFDPR